ncbi:hypothetical protein ACHAW6_014851 [Cyclotella cf. meneghiniana]
MDKIAKMHTSSIMAICHFELQGKRNSLEFKLGVNLGPSLHHAPNINLVLNLDTGLVSLQFYCRYDAFFETISFNKLETMMSLNWQNLAHLERLDRTPMVEQVLQGARPF